MDQNVDLRRLINIYDSGLQPAKAWYGMLFCALLVVSKGWLSIVSPMNVNGFLASYLPVSEIFQPLISHNGSYPLTTCR